MKILELFAGTECVSNAFRRRGHTAYTVDWNERFPSSLHCDIGKISPAELAEKSFIPDVIWAAPDCTTYSVAAISFHRRKNTETGELEPVSEYARQCDATNKNVLRIIRYFETINPELIWFIENPRGGLQKMGFMQKLEKFKHTITYCQYQTDIPVAQRRMKPTNIWTNHPSPEFAPPLQIRRSVPSEHAERESQGHGGSQKQGREVKISRIAVRTHSRHL